MKVLLSPVFVNQNNDKLVEVSPMFLTSLE